jgi:ribonuclease Z
VNFSVTILGSSSALPTSRRFPAAHLLNADEHFYLIDCGEGTQVQLRKFKIKFGKINHIFLSHLHGDHCFGIFGLLSTFDLLGRKTALHIHAPTGFEKILSFYQEYFSHSPSYDVQYHPIDTKSETIIHEDKKIQVLAISLTHKIPTYGFVFREQAKERKVSKAAIAQYQLGLKDILRIKHGEDYVDENGNIIPNSQLSITPPLPRSYAYITDTVLKESILKHIKDIDLLYHESTFLHKDLKLARETCHTTAKQAAFLALKACARKLLIGHFSSRYPNEEDFLTEAMAVFENTVMVEDGNQFNIEHHK